MYGLEGVSGSFGLDEETIHVLSHPLAMDLLHYPLLNDNHPLHLSQLLHKSFWVFASIPLAKLNLVQQVRVAHNQEAISLLESLVALGLLEQGENEVLLSEKGLEILERRYGDKEFEEFLDSLKLKWGSLKWIEVVRSAARLTQVINILGEAEQHRVAREDLQQLMDGEAEMSGHTKRILRSFPLYIVSSDEAVSLTTLGVWLARGGIKGA